MITPVSVNVRVRPEEKEKRVFVIAPAPTCTLTLFSTRSRDRTGTVLLPLVFETSASTNSAIRACNKDGEEYCYLQKYKELCLSSGMAELSTPASWLLAKIAYQAIFYAQPCHPGM